MTNIPLTVTPDPTNPANDIITWTAVPGAGAYRLRVDGVWRSSSFNGAKTTWRVKRGTWAKDRYVVRAWPQAFAEGTYPAVSSPRHKHRLTVQPGGHDPDSQPGNPYAFCYAKFKSPTTLYVNDGHPRTIAWGPGQLYAGRKVTVLQTIFPETGDQPDCVLNTHNHPNYGGWEPDNSTGVSPILLKWQGDMKLCLQAEGARTGNYARRWQFAPKAEIDAQRGGGQLKIRFDITIGYDDGRVVAYLNDKQRFDTGPVATHWPSQTAYSLYEGIYNSSGIQSVEEHSFLASQVGRDLAEATTDVPVEVSLWGSTFPDGSPAWTHKVIA